MSPDQKRAALQKYYHGERINGRLIKDIPDAQIHAIYTRLLYAKKDI